MLDTLRFVIHISFPLGFFHEHKEFFTSFAWNDHNFVGKGNFGFY